MWIETVWRDLRYAIRILGRNPGFGAVAVLSLALGIGANVAAFTLINALLLRELPVPHPEQLVDIGAKRANGHVPFSYPMFRELARGQRVFSELLAWSQSVFSVEVDGELSQNAACAVTGNYYSELGAAPLLGRLVAPADEDASNGSTSQVAVLSYEFWRRRFGGASDVLGKQIRIEGQPFTIIGVTDREFIGMELADRPEINIPISAMPLIMSDAFTRMEDRSNVFDVRSLLWLRVTGRLKKGVTMAQAQAQLESFWPDLLKATTPTQTPGPRLERFLTMKLDMVSAATGTAVDLRSQFRHPLYILLGIVGLILLLACTNLANLMLARTAARTQEMSVRAALGASRWVLARQGVTESLVLSIAGAVLGLGFSYWGSRFVAAQMAPDSVVPIALDLGTDWRVLSATVILAILTGILIGLIPAWRASREDPRSAMQQSGRSLTLGASGAGKGLIVAQVALSFILVLGAGLLVRTFQKLRSIDPGFEQESLLEASLLPRPGGYHNLDMKTYEPQLMERISAVPGVRSASLGGVIPEALSRKDTVSTSVTDPGVQANMEMVSPGFFRTLGIKLLAGRDFEWTDDAKHPHLAIVSRSLADRLFPDGGAIGRHIRFGFLPDYEALEIVGIVANASIFDLRDRSGYLVYVPNLQFSGGGQRSILLIRAAGAPEALARSVAREIQSLGHEYAFRTRTAPQLSALILTPERVTATLSGFFALLALLLAAIGLYGLMSYTVTRRTREIGIRMALGARQKGIFWTMLRAGLALVLLGMALGIPCALGASRFLASMLFGVSPSDPATIASASVVLLAVGLLACYIPARRATKVDPMVALRWE